ncbi:hypothetical protein ID856_14375 [Xenorhabdus sp. 18]|nr:hypothetical protein [Xenorhabdus sp. 18]MBD2797711.1 hypothetical protein [Xenorhabdus sp. 18]
MPESDDWMGRGTMPFGNAKITSTLPDWQIARSLCGQQWTICASSSTA